MIRIVYGKAKSGKTHQIYGEIYDKAHQNQSSQTNRETSLLYLIVPEQYTLEAEKQLIEHAKAEGFIGIEVVSFKRLAYKVFSEVGRPNGVQISEIGKIMMLRRLFTEAQQDLTVYQSAYNKLGFLTKFHDLIKEFKQNMITPDMLSTIVNNLDNHPLLKNKLSDFNIVYKAYEAEKKDAYFDDEDFYDTLLSHLSESKKLKEATIWIDGFDSYTVQELEILSVLSVVSKELTVTICSDGLIAPGYFEHTNTFFKRFVQMSKENGVELKTIKCTQESPSRSIEHISENLLAYPYKSSEIDKESIKLFAANNRLDETEYCAAKIMELVRTKGYKWQDFAVITNDLESYSMSVKRIFDEFELPYFLDQKIKVANNPLVHIIKSYLKLYSEGFSPEEMVSFLKTGFLDLDVLSIYKFELYVKQFGIREKKLLKPFENDMQDIESINKVREMLVSLIYPEFKTQHLTVKVALEKLFELLINLKVNEKIDKDVRTFISKRHYSEAQQFAQIWNKTIDLFDQLVELMGDEVVTLDELIEIIDSGFESMEVGVLPLNESQILVGSVDRSRAHPIKVLFFLGLNDGIVPEIGNDQQLILDSEKEVFSQQGLKLLADSKIFANKEQFNIYFALTRPTEKLYFSYARSDAEGSALRPSYYINKLTKICTNLITEDEKFQSDDLTYKISNEKGTLKHMAMEMRRALDGFPVSKEWETTYAWYSKYSRKNAELLLLGLTHTNSVEKLSKKAVLAAYDLPVKTSVSRLEQYIKCPFKYFVESGLQPLPQRTYELGAPDIGILFHRALEYFGKTIYEENIDWNTLSKEKSDQIIDSIIDQITEAEIFRSKFQYQYLIKKLKRVSKKAAWILTEQLFRGDFVPSAFEVAFGEGLESVAPILIELSNGEKLLIRGVIDRVDTVSIDGKTYVKITDYKSGRKSLNLSDIYNGLQMQLMIYLNACLENPHFFKTDNVLPAGAFYFRIDDPIIESTDQLAETIEDKIASELKLDGISLEDIIVLKHIDDQLFENKNSKVIQVKVKTDGNFSNDSKLMSLESFEGMIKHVKKTIVQIGDELLDGKIEISPCKTDGFVSCQFCDFKALCQFDTQFEGNSYRKLKSLSNSDVIEKVKGY